MAVHDTPAAAPSHRLDRTGTEVLISPLELQGTLVLPAEGLGLVLFAHGSGSSRLSPRNRFVAERLQSVGLGTLLFDLLREEEASDRRNVFDIRKLADRLAFATEWVRSQTELKKVPLGYFGASTGAAAALLADTITRHPISAIVSRGGRPDLAGASLPLVHAPTLLIVGGNDFGVIELNEQAFKHLTCEKQLMIVPGASHLFEEPGTLEAVVAAAQEWFTPRLRMEA
jgi:putative phosphoribosyl transferase